MSSHTPVPPGPEPQPPPHPPPYGQQHPGYPPPPGHTPPPPGYGAPPPGYGGPPPGYGPPYSAPFPPPYDPNAPYGYHPATGLPYSHKSKLAAGLFGILLGEFGVGRFYTGHVGMGIAQIAVTWCTCGLGVIWPIIDGILILVNGGTDSQGLPLRER